ncbi:hypothetical protein [Gardnerella sp. Marseille-Q2328]|uniref:hypothetical protein n=1 Tax=Gardnerella sp. Marseille-Q2328 TaxID=2759694 RepID=UPI002024C3EB|nr:hypothetical protein [Gardnerella sp. Marseille-Q2328]
MFPSIYPAKNVEQMRQESMKMSQERLQRQMRARILQSLIYQKEQEKILNASPHSKSSQVNSSDDEGLSNK